ncbi:glutamyl-tRNA reductase [Psychrosphaera sp. B3R10]|uniref:glutamyl-tRNA reductase n=1 Tax=unclassified Psychrosphaera TaxID=2641570 RepID=UPI001C093149|nr:MULTISPECIES: glutamyl-tRNA reductase [unclassified Psychrosphaera]MBU2882791.1 glutamyl-tRNA reductase [Psychrosphaera sp. I2R16]MBU2988059.1 glutamyl-tRNA reductase [Psychrosphaera sp. B3R10]
MTVIALGLNHKSASVELRERLAFTPDNLPDALKTVQKEAGCDEAVILSTCNRTEIYCFGDVAEPEKVIKWLADFHQLNPADLQQHLYIHRDVDATRHLMRVASGLDSMVIGEPQILGQVKQAYQQAKSVGTIKTYFERMFQQSFSVAKKVRTETDISVNAVSVAFAAVTLAKQVFGQFTDKRVLLVGAGETIELVAKHIYEQGAKDITVANRTLSRAEAVAEQFSAKTCTLSQISEKIMEADVVISSTASTLPIIGKGMIENVLKKRKHRPMFLVDLAVPRDIESQVADLDDAYLYTVDDLQDIVANNMQARSAAAEDAEIIINDKAFIFDDWLSSLDSVDLIKDYRDQSISVKDELLERALNQLQSGNDAEQVLKELANKLTNRLIHAPTSALKDAAEKQNNEELAIIKTVLGIQ